MLPPDSAARGGVQPAALGAAHVEALHQALRMRRAAPRRTSPRREKPGCAALEHRVLPQRQVADHAHGVAVFGDARHAGMHPGARRGGQRAAGHLHVPASGATRPHSRSASACWPLPATPAMATTSPARKAR
jgi:hypothetical protein